MANENTVTVQAIKISPSKLNWNQTSSTSSGARPSGLWQCLLKPGFGLFSIEIFRELFAKEKIAPWGVQIGLKLVYITYIQNKNIVPSETINEMDILQWVLKTT